MYIIYYFIFPMLIEQKIYDIINESIRSFLIERLVKVLKKLPNTQQIDVEKLSKHFKKDRRSRNNIIQNLGGFGTPIATFLVFDYDNNCNKLHTITDNGICIVQNEKTKKIITIFPITFAKIYNYWKQLSNLEKPKLPRQIWQRRNDIKQFNDNFNKANELFKEK